MTKYLVVAVSTLVFLFGCKGDEQPLQQAASPDIPADPGGYVPAATINNITAIGGTFSKRPSDKLLKVLSTVRAWIPPRELYVTITDFCR